VVVRAFPWRAIPAEFGVSGFVCRYERHCIYWKLLEDGAVGIVTILHEKMHQMSGSGMILVADVQVTLSLDELE
jgi:toxin ParE1/3/4